LEIENFMQPMGRLSMHSWMIQFFLFEREREGGKQGFFFCLFPFFPMCSHHVLNEFSNSQRVPKFPKCFQMHSPRYSQ
jgi:hypothetical protein